MNKTVFHFAAWYPHKFDSMFGLFVKRHLETISDSINTALIFILFTKDVKSKQIEINTENNIYTIRIFLPISKFEIPFFTKIFKQLKFFYYQYKAYKIAKQKFGKPQYIHVHILTRTSIIPFLLSKKLNIPLIITEHWSRYYDENYSYKGILRKTITEYIVKRAKYITVVSEALKEAMLNRKILGNYLILPNYINTEVFKPLPINKPNKKIITNITCFEDKSKNISGIIKAISLLSIDRNDFELHFVGTGEDFDFLKNLSDELALTDKYIFFKGLMQVEELVNQINKSHVSLLFSNYETFGIVAYESIACGVHVISTDVAGLKYNIKSEYITFVEKNNITSLKNAISKSLDTEYCIDRQAMHKEINKSFSENKIKSILQDIYK